MDEPRLFPMRRLENVRGEFSLTALAYNLTRAVKLVGIPGDAGCPVIIAANLRRAPANPLRIAFATMIDTPAITRRQICPEQHFICRSKCVFARSRLFLGRIAGW
jgi:hypothetical protein